MELIIVADLDPSSPKMGGIAGYTRQLLDYLEKSGVKTTLLGVLKDKGSPQNYVTTLIPVIQKKRYTGYEYLIRLTMKALFLHIPESAIIHAQQPAYMLPFILFHLKNPRILTIHGQVLDKIKLKRNALVRFMYEMVEAFVLKRCDAVIVVDEITGKSYRQRYPWLIQPKLIPTGICLDKFKLMDRKALRIKYGFKPDDKVVAYVGRLEKEKGPDFLLDCFESLKQLVPEALVVLIGDGKDRSYLEDKVSGMNLGKVSFMGAREPDTIPEIMNCVDVLALCSVYEGSPTVVKEALACGVPVVSTDVGDVRQILRDKNIGRVVSRNKDDYTHALADMLLIERKEGIRGECAAAARQFSFERVGAETVEVYRELSGEKE